MILQSIELSNYRQYLNATIRIPKPDENGHITVIVGRMGYGKTNILNAINWCLYETEPHLGLARRALPILSSIAKASMTPGDRADVQVKLVFLDEGRNTDITRKARFLKTDKGTVEQEKINGQWSVLTIGHLHKRDYEFYQYPELYIERVMPEAISSYFMFDGEKLDKYFLEQTVSKIRGAIHGISKLDLFDKVIEKLNSTKSSFERKYRDPSPQMKTEQTTVEHLQNEIDEREKKLKESKEKESKLTKLKSDLGSALRSSNIEVIREKQKRRTSLDERKEELESRLQEQQTRRKKLIQSEFALATSGDLINRALTSISDVQKGDEIPAPFRTVFLKRLMKEERCICGRDIKPGSSEERTILEKMQANIPREMASTQLPLLVSDLHELNSSKQLILTNLISVESSIEDIEGQAESIGSELEKIHNDIKEFDNIDIVLLEKREADVRQQLEILSIDRIANTANLESLERQKKKAEVKLDQTRRSINKYKDLNDQRDLCVESLKLGQRTSEQVLDSIRAQVDKITSEEGLKALNDPKVQSISIGQDFMTSVKVRGYEHEEGIGSLSAGQRASLALTFLHALNSVSVWETPIIIDTPLGRIDLQDREPLVNALKDQMKGKQVIVFATSAEYTPQERRALLPVVQAEYEIFRNEDGTSEVRDYGGS